MKATLNNKLHLTDIAESMRTALIQRLQFANPKWLENERLGRWNRGTPRVLRYYRKKGPRGLIIPRGYMRQLILMAKDFGQEMIIEDRRRRLAEIDFRFSGNLKPFQQDAVEKMLKRDFGTLSAPTGSGKTVMALNMIARRRQPALIVVHTKDLALQWIERIHTFLGIPRENIGLIGGGGKKAGPQISVALVQSLYKKAGQISPGIGFLVVDECHRAPSRTFTEAVTAFDAKYMLGLSATPWRRDRLSKLIYWHLGDVHHQIDRPQLVADGHILDVDVIVRPTSFKPYYDPVNEYSKMLSELTGNDARNRLIVDDIAREAASLSGKHALLVLSDRKQHCTTLQALLKHRHHIPSEVLTGDVPLSERNQIIRQLGCGQTRVLVATGQLIGEGFDCPNLSMLFMTTPVRFSGRVLQYLGRILRPSEGVQRARVYDYVDVHVAPLAASAKARQRIYATNSQAVIEDEQVWNSSG